MSDAHDAHSASESKPGDSGLQSIARRHAILKGMGKTAALAGAAVPLSSLAGKDQLYIPKTGKNYMCTLSGQNSVVHSATLNAATACGAKAPAHYGSTSNWPGGCCYNGTYSWQPTALFWQCFGLQATASGNRSKSLTYLVNNLSTSDEAHWVTAMLNANKFSSSFPYSASEVMAMYSAANSATALTFFKSYLEQG